MSLERPSRQGPDAKALIESSEGITHKKLLAQFDNPHTLELNGKPVDVVDIVPEDLKTEVPTLVIPGFSATPEALKDSIIRIAEAGRRVISAYAPHGIPSERAEGDLPPAEMRKLELLLSLLEKKELQKINVIANSEGAISVAVAAVLYPEKFENIVLVEPAGIVGTVSALELIRRTLADAADQASNKDLGRAQYPAPRSVGIKSILSNLVATVQEIRSIGQADITPALAEIHSKGIGVSIIHAVDDKVFSMEKVLQMVHANMLDGFYSIKGNHMSLYERDPIGRAAEAALSALEFKKANAKK